LYFIASYQYTALLNLHPLVFGLTTFYDWLLSNKLNPTYSIISLGNIIFNLLQSFQKHKYGVKQELGPLFTD